ncbi:hypothetical protein L0F63_000533, partial [Massospora cicadina]
SRMPMKEGILAPDLCDDAMDEDDKDFTKIINTNHAILWGEDEQYILMEPVSTKLRKMVHKIHKWEAAKAASLVASSIDLNQIQEYIEEINQANQSEQNANAGEDMEELTKPPN